MNFFTTPFFFSKKIPFGLDLSDLSVKIVHLGLSRCGSEVVSAFGSVPISPGSIMDGEIKDADSVRRAIEQCMQKANVRSRRVFCSLPEGKSFLRIIEMPNLPDRELEESIRFQIEENIPMGLDQLYYDWMRVRHGVFSQKEKIAHVLLVAVTRNVADTFLQTIESAGLEVVGMGTESIAQTRSLLFPDAEEKKEGVALLVDVGDRRTTLTFVTEGIPCFTSSSQLSSQMMTEAIAKTLRVSREKAEQIKWEHGIGSFVARDPVFCSVESVLEHLINHIQTSIDFFTGGLRFSHSVERIILCGGGAVSKGLPVYLERKLKRKVELGNPCSRILGKRHTSKFLCKEAPRYSTAIGLALQGLQYAREE